MAEYVDVPEDVLSAAMAHTARPAGVTKVLTMNEIKSELFFLRSKLIFVWLKNRILSLSFCVFFLIISLSPIYIMIKIFDVSFYFSAILGSLLFYLLYLFYKRHDQLKQFDKNLYCQEKDLKEKIKSLKIYLSIKKLAHK